MAEQEWYWCPTTKPRNPATRVPARQRWGPYPHAKPQSTGGSGRVAQRRWEAEDKRVGRRQLTRHTRPKSSSAHDGVFAEVLTVLHFDEDEILGAGVLHAVRHADRYVDRAPGLHFVDDAVERDLARAANDEQCSERASVHLVAQRLPAATTICFTL